MKILLLTRPVCPPWDEASKNFAYTLAINVKNAEIHILTKGVVENLPENVIQHPIYSSGKWNLIQKIRAYLFLVKVFLVGKGKGFDVLHSFFTPTRLNVFALKLCLRNKKIRTIQTLATLRDDVYGNEKLKKMIHADMIITYSDYARKKLSDLGFENVRRIYPGLDLSDFVPREKNSKLMSRYNIYSIDFVINYTGEYTRLGAIDDVIESFIDIAGKNQNLKLQLACRIKNKQDAKIKKLVIMRLRDAHFLDRVSFADDGDYNMPDIYNLCDISIFPVRDMMGKFDIPLAIIEAMACEKPIVVTNIEKLKYFLDEENSILINPGDREALKEKILYLYNNSGEREKIGKAGKEFVKKNFDISNVVEEYEKVYREVADAKNNAVPAEEKHGEIHS